jgi:hypothetical protein
MKANYKRVLPARFGPETRFEVRPVPPAPFREVEDTELEVLKNRLLVERLWDVTGAELNARLRRAANEAAALAWASRYPLLVFPALFDELARSAKHADRRQNRILERSRELLVV